MLDSTIRRLCNYYLSCLANDDAGGVAIDMRSSGDSDFVELTSLELDGAKLPGWNEKLADFVSGRRAREPGLVRLGYPIFSMPGRKDAHGRRLMPLFLIDVDTDQTGIEPDWRTCSLNLEAVRELEGNGIAFAQHAVAELEEGLGLDVNGEPKPFADVVERLKLLRPDWPWAGAEDEDAPPKNLFNSPPGQIYERGCLVRVLRPFTQGLEVELQKLAQVPEHTLHGTALGALLFGDGATRPAEIDSTQLIEVLPMNPEQRAAVRMALVEPLSIITGPPGTGKSQVVANLLVNCTWRRRPVLFTSKNNKAVDVVDSRVNSLGRKPVMVRLGAKEHRHKLAEQLSYLIEGTVTHEDLDELKRERANYENLIGELAKLDEEERAALELHDQAQRLIDELQEIGHAPDPRRMDAAKRLNIEIARTRLYGARDTYLDALPERQSRWMRLIWRWARIKRIRSFEAAIAALKNAMGPSIAGEAPSIYAPEDEPEAWKQYLLAQSKALTRAERLLGYTAALRSLREVSFGELAERRNELQQQLVEVSVALWQRWVTAQPALLKPSQRLLLSRYSAVLKSVMDTGSADMLPNEVRREYEQLVLEAPDVVSCFSVTALSAKNRVPFTPGYFDLVVFDESTQCDLASALPILYRAKRAVIIGDPKQLQHIASLRRDRDSAFMVDQKLEHSFLDWQFSTQSLFALVAGRVSDNQKISLRDHHRSHPNVIGYSNEAFYDNSLRVVTLLPHLKRFSDTGPAVRWIQVNGKAQRGQNGSVYNQEEVLATVAEVRRIVSKGYKGSIGVVTPFSYQADRIRRELEKDAKLWERLRTDHDFQSATAHGFQGDERDLMIFSVVAANGIGEGSLKFLQDTGNVFNVAITRARAELVVIGDSAWCVDAPVTHLRDFARYALSLAREHEDQDKEETHETSNRTLSTEERTMSDALTSMGLKVKPGFQVEQYRIDLAVFNGSRRLALDILDRSAPGEWGAEALEREQLKRQRLLKLGWAVTRFWPLQVRDDFQWCLAQVDKWAHQGNG